MIGRNQPAMSACHIYHSDCDAYHTGTSAQEQSGLTFRSSHPLTLDPHRRRIACAQPIATYQNVSAAVREVGCSGTPAEARLNDAALRQTSRARTDRCRTG